MLHFNLEKPVEFVWAGEFVSPEQGWKHLTRVLIDYELMIVTEGVLFIADENEEHEVKAGEYLVMPPTRFQHGTRECRCRFYWLHFRAEALPASLSLPAHGKFSNGAQLSAVMKLLFQAEAESHRGIRSHYLATGLLLELAAQVRSLTPAVQALDAPQQLCRKVKMYIRGNPFTNVRVSEIARGLGYHEKYLSTVFRETEGITIKRYLTNLRMTEARRLLLETDYTVKEIGYCLTFESPHNFSRFFKTEEGVTPLEYRAKRNKE